MSVVRQNEGGIRPEALRRKQWIRPTLRILAASSAELAVGAIDDNADFS